MISDAKRHHGHVNVHGELSRVWRHHAIFVASSLPMLHAGAFRRHDVGFLAA